MRTLWTPQMYVMHTYYTIMHQLCFIGIPLLHILMVLDSEWVYDMNTSLQNKMEARPMQSDTRL